MDTELKNYIEAEKKKKREYMRLWVSKNKEKWRKYNRDYSRRVKNIDKDRWRIV